ncbi:uncharacterized protein LOC104907155 isoform X2 [Beta vulgaris subsp. vulgaris]|uniref:uncharacterized protein LOC104907155 isoform X2 n=1 Tax=Beta vulgaris subsp. vulgaris TaxID=3555 RepID=UPI002547FF14|nr:uncharacterized protein LOC104907155 isoform X2 [Beta vulgaris subsp. vulgaris]
MKKMVTLRLTSLILAVLLVLHALKHSLAQAHQANKVANAISRQNHVFSRKELVDGNNYLANTKKTTPMGGRKMMVTHKVIEAKDDHRVTKNPTSVFSGNDETRNALETLL